MWCGKKKKREREIWNRKKIKELNSVAEEYNKRNEKHNREQSTWLSRRNICDFESGGFKPSNHREERLKKAYWSKLWDVIQENNIHIVEVPQEVTKKWAKGFFKKKWLNNSSESGHPCFVPEEIIIEKDTCILMFIATQFTIARTWKQPRCSSTDE